MFVVWFKGIVEDPLTLSGWRLMSHQLELMRVDAFAERKGERVRGVRKRVRGRRANAGRERRRSE